MDGEEGRRNSPGAWDHDRVLRAFQAPPILRARAGAHLFPNSKLRATEEEEEEEYRGTVARRRIRDEETIVPVPGVETGPGPARPDLPRRDFFLILPSPYFYLFSPLFFSPTPRRRQRLVSSLL